MRFDRLIATTALLTCVVLSQQPNAGGVSSMIIDGIDGPPYPIEINVRTSTMSIFQITGSSNATFSIVRSASGSLENGSAVFFGDLCDLPLSPPLVVCLDGIANPAFVTDLNGQFSFGVLCPPAGNPPSGIPLNFHAAYQAAIVDYFSSYGWSLTAATRVTVIQGPTVVNIQTGIGNYGNSGVATVNLAPFGLSFPFYGSNYNTVHISGDGYMTFGGSQAPDFTPSNTEMDFGPPRIAGLWTDLDQLGPAIIRYTIDSVPPPGILPFLFVEFINVSDAVGGFLHNLTWKIDTQGNVRIHHLPTNNASIYDMIVGIGGGGTSSYTQPTNKDLSTMLSPNSYQGAVNESFYEWFGIVTQNVYFPYPTDNPYDLYARTLNFVPNGSGSLPQSTNRYQLY